MEHAQNPWRFFQKLGNSSDLWWIFHGFSSKPGLFILFIGGSMNDLINKHVAVWFGTLGLGFRDLR
jgi:hypothetical protein